MNDVQENALAVQIKTADLADADATMLQAAFTPFFEQAQQWRQKADAIQVKSADDKEGMKTAREARLALKDIRVSVEKTRKELKEESLRKGKAIDGMANVIKFLIVPIEEHLQKQEDFVKIQEEKRKQELKEKREAELAEYEVDTSFYNLADMPEESYAKLLESSKAAFVQRKEAEQKAEEERIAREKAEAEENERVRLENERLRKEAEEKEKALAKEREERERAEREIQEKKAAEENARKEAEERKRQEALAPDKEKLVVLADRIMQIQMPDVSSEEAKKVVAHAVELLGKASSYVKTQSVNL